MSASGAQPLASSPLTQPQAFHLGDVLCFLDHVAGSGTFLGAGIDGGDRTDVAESFASLEIKPAFDAFVQRGNAAIAGYDQSYAAARDDLLNFTKLPVSAQMDALSSELRKTWKAMPDFDKIHPAFFPYSLKSLVEHRIVEKSAVVVMAASMKIYLENAIKAETDFALNIFGTFFGTSVIFGIGGFAGYHIHKEGLSHYIKSVELFGSSLPFSGTLLAVVATAVWIISHSRPDSRQLSRADRMLSDYQRLFSTSDR